MTPDQAIAALVKSGAALTPTLAGVPVPVGIMQRVGPSRWFWFAAGGETEFDAHVIDGDAKVLYDGGAVEFTRDGEFAGYLTSLVESLDEEPALAAAKTVREWKARYDRDAELRGFITRRLAEAAR